MGGNDGTTDELIANDTSESDVIDQIDTSASGISSADLVDAFETAQATLEACENDNKVPIVYTNDDSRPGVEADRQAVSDAAADAAGVDTQEDDVVTASMPSSTT